MGVINNVLDSDNLGFDVAHFAGNRRFRRFGKFKVHIIPGDVSHECGFLETHLWSVLMIKSSVSIPSKSASW